MDWWEIILGLLAIGLGSFIGAKTLMKKKIKQLREFARSLDEALADDKLTKEEALDIWGDLKALMGI